MIMHSKYLNFRTYLSPVFSPNIIQDKQVNLMSVLYWNLLVKKCVATGPSTFLEGIGEVPDLQVAKTGKLSIF